MASAQRNDYSSSELVDKFDVWYESLPISSLASYNTLRYFGPSIEGKTVADYGCGSGKLLRICAQAGASQCMGVDCSTAMIDKAKKLDLATGIEEGHIRYFEASCFAPLSIRPSNVDLATSHFVLYHCATRNELTTFYRNVYNDLKPGGKMFTFLGHYMAKNELDQKLAISVFGADLPTRAKHGNQAEPIGYCVNAYMPAREFHANADEAKIEIPEVPLFTFDKCYFWSAETIMGVMQEEKFVGIEAIPVQVPEEMDPNVRIALSRMCAKHVVVGGVKPQN